MSKGVAEASDDTFVSIDQPGAGGDPLGSTAELVSQEIPAGADRRTFLMRGAVVSAAALITGRGMSAEEKASRSSGPPGGTKVSPNLNVVKKQKGPVMTTLDEFYKVGPGPSSSHTIGPMRITMTSTSDAPSCRRISSPRPPDLKSICMGASAPPVRGMVPSARRSRGWLARSRRPSIRRFSTA